MYIYYFAQKKLLIRSAGFGWRFALLERWRNSGAAVQAIWVPFDHESQNPVDQIRSHAQPDFRFGIRGGCDLAFTSTGR